MPSPFLLDDLLSDAVTSADRKLKRLGQTSGIAEVQEGDVHSRRKEEAGRGTLSWQRRTGSLQESLKPGSHCRAAVHLLDWTDESWLERRFKLPAEESEGERQGIKKDRRERGSE